MSTANSFVHLELAVDFDDWFTWAVDNRIHKDVVGFLQFSKKDLYDFDPKSPSRSFATPRTWSFVSELLEDELDEETTTDLVSGCVGEGLALKFVAHRKVASQMPNPTDILSGKVKELQTKECARIQRSPYELKEASDKGDKDFDNMVDRFLRFMMDNFETELVVMGVKLVRCPPIDPTKLNALMSFMTFW